MKILKRFFAADPVYREQMEQYSMRDTLISAGYYLLILVIYYLMGRIQAQTGRYYAVAVNILLMVIPVLLCIRCLSRTGISRRNLLRSVIVATVIGILVLLSFSVIPGILSHRTLLPAGNILYNVFFYFVIIGLSEEISFRGFIQPRLYPLLKSEWLTILAGGILFLFMHYPYQMAARSMSFAEYWPRFIENAPIQFLWHLAFTALYRRYGNIFGSTILHGFVDMTGGLFG